MVLMGKGVSERAVLSRGMESPLDLLVWCSEVVTEVLL